MLAGRTALAVVKRFKDFYLVQKQLLQAISRCNGKLSSKFTHSYGNIFELGQLYSDRTPFGDGNRVYSDDNKKMKPRFLEELARTIWRQLLPLKEGVLDRCL